MRLWHLAVGIVMVAIILSIARDAVGLVGLVVFVMGLGEVVLGTTALMALFQTVGAFGEAKRLSAHAEAIAATALVLAVATSTMTGLFFAGAWIVKAVTS